MGSQRVVTLSPAPHYDLALSTRLLARYHCVLDIDHEDGYTRALQPVSGVPPVLIRATQPAPSAPITLTQLTPSPADGDRLWQQAAHVLALDQDFSAFYQQAATHPKLAPVVAPLIGLTHFRSETVFEALMIVIIEQQISLYAALRAHRALAVWGDQSVVHDGDTYYTFPTPAQIAHADPLELHAVLKITHRRIAIMQGIARELLDGSLPLENLCGQSAPAAYGQLVAIKGIGHWTAAWTLIRACGKYDSIASNDVALRAAVAHYIYDQAGKVSADAVDDAFAPFASYAGLAAYYTLMRWAQAHY